MKKKKVVCAVLSATMLMSMCTFGVSAMIGEQSDGYIIGDVNKDGIVDINDATVLQQFLAKYDVDFEGMPKAVIDVDNNNTVDVNDVTMIQMYLAKYNVNSDIGKPYVPQSEEAATDDETSEPTVPEPTTPVEVWHPAEYEYVEHPAETVQVWVVDKEATKEEQLVYERVYGEWYQQDGSNLLCIDGTYDENGRSELSNYLRFYKENYGVTTNWIMEEDWMFSDTYRSIEKLDDKNYVAIPESMEYIDLGDGTGYLEPVWGDDYDPHRRVETQEYLDDLAWDISANPELYPEYRVEYVYYTYCTACHDNGEEGDGYVRLGFGPWSADTEADYAKAEQALAEHLAEHDANGEKYEQATEWWTVPHTGLAMYKIVDVPEQGHYETQVVKEAWTEKVLVKEGYWG